MLQVSNTEVGDVTTTLGVTQESLSEPEKDQIKDWISKTERIIRKRLGDLSRLDPEDLRDVISEVVARRFRNPEGKKYERIDDYGYGFDEDTAKGSLYLTDSEWDQLTPDIPNRSVGMASVIGSAGYGPSAASAFDHPVRGWWD